MVDTTGAKVEKWKAEDDGVVLVSFRTVSLRRGGPSQSHARKTPDVVTLEVRRTPALPSLFLSARQLIPDNVQ